MAEDKDPNIDPAPAAPAPVAPVAPVNPALADGPVIERTHPLEFIANLADSVGIKDQGVEDIKTTAQKIVRKAAGQPEPAPVAPVAPVAPAAVDPAAPAAPVAPVDPAAPAAPAEPVAPVDPNNPDSVFFGNRGKNKVPEFKTVDEINTYIKERYAIDIKEPSDYQKLFSSVDGWRTDAQNHAKQSKDHEDLLAAFQDLPPALSEAFQTWAAAGDWEASLKDAAGRIDYTREFGNHSKEDVLKTYYPEEFRSINANEDLDDDQRKSQLEVHYGAAARLYANDKHSFDVQRADAITRQDTKNRLFKESAVSSVQHLKEKYPDFSASDLQSVQDSLVGGSVYNLLFEKDGTYTKDAAVRAALLMFGEKEIERNGQKAAAAAASQANLDIVTRGGDKPTDRGGSQLVPDTSAAKKVEKLLSGVIDTSPYTHKGD